MSASDLVSVVIPCFRQARYLPESVGSVLAQTHRNFEIIIIDDGSPDNTSEVAARYPQVRCIRQGNKGGPAARNAGIREAKGNFIVFLDADDRLLPPALELGVALLTACPDYAFISGHNKMIS